MSVARAAVPSQVLEVCCGPVVACEQQHALGHRGGLGSHHRARLPQRTPQRLEAVPVGATDLALEAGHCRAQGQQGERAGVCVCVEGREGMWQGGGGGRSVRAAGAGGRAPETISISTLARSVGGKPGMCFSNSSSPGSQSARLFQANPHQAAAMAALGAAPHLQEQCTQSGHQQAGSLRRQGPQISIDSQAKPGTPLTCEPLQLLDALR